MKRSSKILSALLLLFAVCCSFTVSAQSTAPSEIYEAEGRHCDDCKGSGKLTCLHCHGKDLTQKVCPQCKGEDLTQKLCVHCKGEDLTHRTCKQCKGEDLTLKACLKCGGRGIKGEVSCVYCRGRGTQSRCIYCGGRGTQSRCIYCSGGGTQSRCIYCSGRGTQSRCIYCGGKAFAGAACQTCNGSGTIELLIAKHSSLDELRKRITQLDRSPTAPRGPPTSTISDVLTAADGSHFGELSKETGRPKTVFVNGYTRKDGTYVKSHFRSLPSSQVVSKEPALRFSPAVAENGSYYGEPNQYGVPKTVPVGGYYRKDGTYVRGHYRSAPRR